MESKTKALNDALASADAEAQKLVSDKVHSASGHLAAVIGRIKGAQELVGFLDKAVAATPAPAPAPEAVKATK
jgi:hypothetical protein